MADSASSEALPSSSAAAAAGAAAAGSAAGPSGAAAGGSAAAAVPKLESAAKQLVTLVSSDGVKFQVPRDAAELSGLIRTTIGATSSSGSGGDGADSAEGASSGGSAGTASRAEEDLPLPNVRSSVLKSILEFLKHHSTHPMPAFKKPLQADLYGLGLSLFDVHFIEKNRTQQDIYDIIAAAMFLDIPALVDLGCAKIASLLKGKNPREIRETFGVDTEFTAQERAAVSAKYPFLAQAEAANQNLTDTQVREQINAQMGTAAAPAAAAAAAAAAPAPAGGQ